MTRDAPDEYFADLISNVSHANGVFRITFAQQQVDNEIRPVARLLVPENQLKGMMQAIGGAATEIREKMAAQTTAKPAPKKPAPKKKTAAKKK